jgi:hypothetical protein
MHYYLFCIEKEWEKYLQWVRQNRNIKKHLHCCLLRRILLINLIFVPIFEVRQRHIPDESH